MYIYIYIYITYVYIYTHTHTHTCTIRVEAHQLSAFKAQIDIAIVSHQGRGPQLRPHGCLFDPI